MEANPPIDLRAIAGKRYRVEYEDLHRPTADEPWLLIIPCQGGHVYPHSDKLLGVATEGRGPTAAAIARSPGVEVVQNGDDGINAAFPPSLFAKVAALVKPKRRRQQAPTQRVANRERLAKFAFKSAAQNRTRTGQVDTLAV